MTTIDMGRTGGPAHACQVTRSSVITFDNAPIAESVAFARGREWVLASAALVLLAAAAAGLFLTVWRPQGHPSATHVSSVRVPYSRARFTVADAKRAFAAVGVRLVEKSRVPGVVTTIGTPNDEFEVDVFGKPARVNALGGSPDVITDADGDFVRIPRSCTPGIPDAEGWHGNIRFIVRCAGASHTELLALGARALANL